MKILPQTVSVRFICLIAFVLMMNIRPASAQTAYRSEWSEIEKADKKGLPKSALTIAESICQKAKKAGNHEDYIKSLLYIARYRQQVSEQTLAQQIDLFRSELAQSTGASRAILHSVLGQMYWQYFENNRWQILERTELAADTSSDIAQWTAPRFLAAATAHYRASLAGADYLATLPMQSISVLIDATENKSELLCPSVYDFLAMRAILFFTSSDRSFSAPEQPFAIHGARYFALAGDFCGLQMATRDTASTDYQSVLVMQQYTRHCLMANKIPSLVHTELLRLRYMYEHSADAEKERWYSESLDRLLAQHSAHPQAAYILHAIATRHWYLGTNYERTDRSTYQYQNSYVSAVEFAQMTIDRYPKEQPAQWCRQLIADISHPEVSFVAEPEFAPQQRQAIQLTYTNISSCKINIRRIGQETADEIINQPNLSEAETAQKLFHKSKEVFSDIITLPKQSNYRSATTDYLLPALESGYYVIFVNADASGDRWTPVFATVRVSSIALLLRDIGNTTLIQIMDRTTGEPIEGATVHQEQSGYYCTDNKKLSDLLTDNEGRASVVIGKRECSIRPSIYFKKDTLVSWVWIHDQDYRNSNAYEIFPEFHAALFTDRGIYRPGQTVYFKAIVWQRDAQKYSAVDKTSLKVELRDPNYQVVSTLNLTTNENGSAASTFVLPTTGLNGEYSIQITGDNINEQISISVEDYKRPLIQLMLDGPKGAFAAGDTISLTGTLSSYSGAGLGSATVSYSVYSSPDIMYDRYYSNQPEQKIASGDAVSDAEGRFSFSFIAAAQISGFAQSYLVSVTALDSNGEAQSAETSVDVSADPFTITTQLPALADAAKAISAPVSFLNTSGQPVTVAGGKAFLVRLRTPSVPLRSRLWDAPDTALYSQEDWAKLYPGNPYSNEHSIDEQAFTDTVLCFAIGKTDCDTLRFATDKMLPGNYALVVSATDSKGRKVSYEQRFSVWNSKSSAVQPDIDLRIIPLQSNVSVGGKAIFAVQAAEGTYIMWELEKDGETLDKKSFKSGRKTEIINIPITDKMRGNASLHFTVFSHGRNLSGTLTISVPFTDKTLKLQFASMRSSLLPGSAEKWVINIKNSDGKPVPAEVLASMYDASLDVFRPNMWSFSPYSYSWPQYGWQSLPSPKNSASSDYYSPQYSPQLPEYPQLNLYGLFSTYGNYGGSGRMLKMSMVADSQVAFELEDVAEAKMASANSGFAPPPPPSPEVSRLAQYEEAKPATKPATQAMPRSNMRETAFFFPQVNCLADGSAELSFTAPDALTRWNIQALAHNADMDFGYLQTTIISQKKLMVQPNWPRFVREGDTIQLFARISNLTDSIMLGGTASINITDALTGEPLALVKAPSIRTFNVGRKGSTAISWQMVIPVGTGAISCKIMAAERNYSDGEERILPVLRNRMLVTQSLPLSISGAGQKQYRFDALKNNKSTTLTNHSYTVEFCSNPVWYAIQALPYLIEFPYECAEQTFSRMYANSLGSYILNSSPQFARVIELWRTSGKGESLLSALETNQELKQLLIEETPWLRDAKNESEQKARIAQLLNLDQMRYETDKAATKLAEMQLSSGAWPWFRGGQECRYITQHIVCGLGKLRKLTGADLPANVNIAQALQYIDIQIAEDYARLIRDKAPMDKQQIGYMQAHYLYARSFFPEYPVAETAQKAYSYFMGQAGTYWLQTGMYAQGMIAIAMQRGDQADKAREIMASVNEFAIDNPELGRYWKYTSGWNWHEAPIETQSLLIEAVAEVTQDTLAMNAMKLWLLKQKQTQSWPTTKATADAIYALLLRGSDWTTDTRQVAVSVGGKPLISASPAEAGTGYVKQTWSAADVNASLADISISNPVNRPAWGAAHWQFFENLDKMTVDTSGPLKIKKELYIVNETPQGKKLYPIAKGESIPIGSLVTVRIIIESDRAMDFVHLKDMRAAALEPIPSLSGYRWQGGLSYYQTIRDAAAHFFIDYLPAGKYVFEYDLRAQQIGQFSNGITSIQCMYAPEFGSRSKGTRLSVEK